MLTDIDDRKQGELLLHESELQFKTIFDEAGAGIALVDLKGEAPIQNNRALQKLLGCTEAAGEVQTVLSRLFVMILVGLILTLHQQFDKN